MCQVLKRLSQLLHGQLVLSLTLQLGELPQDLAPPQGAQDGLPRLGTQETRQMPPVKISSHHQAHLPLTDEPHHLPEVDGHLSAVLQHGPDEEGGPGREAALVPVQTLAQQQLVDLLWTRTQNTFEFFFLLLSYRQNPESQVDPP